LLRQPAAGGRGNGNRRATEVGGGRGKGGAGGKKVCVPCTMKRHGLSSKSGCAAARAHSDPVVMDAAHQPRGASACPYCKCGDSKKEWASAIFKLRKDCAICSMKK
jgi:hypothetical protein